MRILKALTFGLGLLLFVWIVRKLGVGNLVEGFQRCGWRLAIPIVLVFPCYLLYTFSWQAFLRRFEHHAIGFWTLFRIKVAGEAANTLTPLNFAGGDPLRIWLLARKFPVSIGGASVVVDRTLQILAVVTLIFLGNIAALVRLEFPPFAKTILGTTAFLLFVLISFFLFQQTRGLFRKILVWVTRLKLRTFSANTRGKIEELDRHLHDFYRRDRGLFFLCYCMHLAARAIGIVEIWLLASLLGVPMGPWEAVFFSAVIPVTNLLGAIVPGTFGVLEGVVSSLFFALHWNPADGIVLQLARRIRACFWILLGMIFLMLARRSPRLDRGPPL